MSRRTSRFRGSTSGTDSTQESLNDLLFNTLGILLLMLLAAFVLIGAPDVSAARLQQAAAALKAREAELADAESKLAQAASERDEAQDAVASLSPRPIDVVIACDGTLSMGPVLAELQTAVKTVAEIGSRLSPRFRLGVVIYRDAPGTHVFPLTVIGPPVAGVESAGMLALRQFTERAEITVNLADFQPGAETGKSTGKTALVTRMSPISAYADVEGAIRRSVEMLGTASPDTRRVLVIMGDMGPWEGGNHLVIEPADRDSAERTERLVRSLAGPDRDTRVLCLYSGRGLPMARLVPETSDFFRRLALAGGGVYTEDTSRIAGSIVEATLAPSNRKGNR
jgi:hypothetical protein